MKCKIFLLAAFILIVNRLLAQDFNLFSLIDNRKSELATLQTTCLDKGFYFKGGKDDYVYWEKQKQQNMQIIFQQLIFVANKNIDYNKISYITNNKDAYEKLHADCMDYFKKIGEETIDGTIVTNYYSDGYGVNLQIEIRYDNSAGTLYIFRFLPHIPEIARSTGEPLNNLSQLIGYLSVDIDTTENDLLKIGWSNSTEKYLDKTSSFKNKYFEASNYDLLALYYNDDNKIIEMRYFENNNVFNKQILSDLKKQHFNIHEKKGTDEFFSKKINTYFLHADVYSSMRDNIYSHVYDVLYSQR